MSLRQDEGPVGRGHVRRSEALAGGESLEVVCFVEGQNAVGEHLCALLQVGERGRVCFPVEGLFKEAFGVGGSAA